MSVANLLGAWFWTFFEACIPSSVLKRSYRTFLVVLNVFWSMHSLFCLEMLLQRVVNVFGGFESFLTHAFPFLSRNALAESCEHFWWFWTIFEACIRLSILKCLWPDDAAYTLLYIHWISLRWFLTIQRWDAFFSYYHHLQLNTRTINEPHLPKTIAISVISCILVHVIYHNTYLPEKVFSNHALYRDECVRVVWWWREGVE